MLTVSLFTIAKRQKQPKYPSIDEQNGHAIKYYPAMKRNPILTHPMTWMNLEILMPIEIRQVQNTYVVGSIYTKSRIGKNRFFPVVQWLKLYSSNAGDMGLIPSWETIPSAQPKNRGKKKKAKPWRQKVSHCCLGLRRTGTRKLRGTGFLLGMMQMFQN